MPKEWTLERLKAKTPQEIRSLHSKARIRTDDEAKRLTALIVDNNLLVDEEGGLPWDHPIMLEIEEICGTSAAIDEAVAASEKGLPALAGMEHRIVAALGENYGTHYTTHHAGRCIADQMLSKGWQKAGQRPMPEGTVARSATVFVKRNAN